VSAIGRVKLSRQRGAWPVVVPSLGHWCAAVALAIATPSLGHAEECQVASRDSAALVGHPWSSPLDRRVSVHVRDISLRDALDRVSVVARLRLSYSAELLPLSRVECVAFDSTAVGDVLLAMLRGTSVTPVTAGADLIVLAPSARDARETAPTMARSVGILDRVVVTGSAAGASQRALTVAVDVVDGSQIAGRNAGSLSEALDGALPGVWSWDQSPVSLLTSYASIRGASSFSVSYPKIYIDGIEVANPLLMSRFNPDAIDRIEVIRGPQGAALYGSDAISGVINIVTRQGLHPGGERISLTSTAGVTASDFAPRSALSQSHALSLRTGSNTRSAGLNVSAGGMGDFVPQGFSRHLLASGSARVVGEHSTITGTARFAAEEAGSPSNPLLSAPLSSPEPGQLDVHDASPQSVREYTVGATGVIAATDRTTQSFVIGVDGYRLANVATAGTAIPSGADSALQAAQGGADRATLRLSRVTRVDVGDRASAALTLAVEHSALRQSISNDEALGTESGSDARTSAPISAWKNNTGLIGQTDVSLRDALFATGGIRIEHNDGFARTSQVAILPMLGTALVGDRGRLTVKLRAAYGKGIRPAQTPSHTTVWQSSARLLDLGPEEQSGTEVGIDVLVRRALTLQITRFDQRASGLIQQVATIPDSLQQVHRMSYALQNVGEITNRGWELQGSTSLSRLSLAATLSFVDSRVHRLAAGYSGDLRSGDRTLEVPAHTMGVSATWNGNQWFASLGAVRAGDWINYDRLALAQQFASAASPAHDFVGARLRNYWRTYDGVTRLRATASRELRRGFAFQVTGDNLLNYQRGEPDNATVVPGRTVQTGVRLRF
jgi:iron complex outermembrane recepter protein